MKTPKIAITVFLLSVTITSFAQLDQGSWMTGGNVGFQSFKASSSASTVQTFYLSPNIGYFFANKVAAGLDFSYYNSSTSLVSVGPFMRGYIKMGKADLFLHARFVYSNVSSSGFTDDQFGFGGGPAFGVFLNDYVALEALFDYYIPDLDAGGSSALALNIGLQIYFPKKD